MARWKHVASGQIVIQDRKPAGLWMKQMGFADESDPTGKSAKEPGASERQEGGSHYKDMAIQPWAVMKANFTPDEYRGFLRGNALKYLMRAPAKGGVLDYKKARHYLDEYIEFEESQP